MPILANLTPYHVTFAWDADTDPNVVGYRLYWGTSSGVYTNHVDLGKTTQARVNGVASFSGSTPLIYYAQAVSLNAAGQEINGGSAEASGRPIWPGS